MRTRAALGSIFGSIAVLVVGWQAAAAAAAHNSSALLTTGSGAPSTASTGAAAPSVTPSAAATPSAASSVGSAPARPNGTFTGSTADTQFGPVQVKITVVSGKITEVTALQLTNSGGRSVQISNYAAPILRREVLAAQSANVNSVGGATYTSEGYLTSLQSALDRAGL